MHLIGRLGRVPAYGLRYTRRLLQQQDQDFARIQQEKKFAAKEALEQRIHNLKANDTNKANYVAVRINHPLFSVPNPVVVVPAILPPEPLQKSFTMISAIRKHIITSIKKSKIAMHPIRRCHIVDAIALLSESHKKVAKLMLRTFYNIIDHARRQGYDLMQLFVHGYLIGRTKRFKGVRYHAKGRGNREKRDFCQIRILIRVKSMDEVLTDMASGNCPASVAALIRDRLSSSETPYESIVNLTSLTTAKGRQQQRELIKRRTDLLMRESLTAGTFLPRRTALEKVVENEKIKIRERIAVLNPKEPSVMLRQRLYKKNMNLA